MSTLLQAAPDRAIGHAGTILGLNFRIRGVIPVEPVEQVTKRTHNGCQVILSAVLRVRQNVPYSLTLGGIMGRRPDEYGQRQQAQGQPPWVSSPPRGFPPTGYAAPGSPPGFPPTGQRGVSSPGYGSAQIPPPRRKRQHKRNAVLLTIVAIFVVGVIANVLGGGRQANTAVKTSAAATAASHAVRIQPSAARSKSSAAPKSTAKAEAACDKRGFASGDIYVRMLSPGTQWVAQELGGEWSWNSVLGKCLTSVQLMIAAAPRSAGNCTQVGYVADNPGYNPNAAVAAPLTHVFAQAGPACPAATTSAPAKTTPAAVPAPPATTAPAGCYPLSDEGTCYEPGEYCRDADHGMSGVAGDGQAIICEDNDGWRWEPA
jgi:hypothetical protein